MGLVIILSITQNNPHMVCEKICQICAPSFLHDTISDQVYNLANLQNGVKLNFSGPWKIFFPV
jgi:hypothetical protein